MLLINIRQWAIPRMGQWDMLEHIQQQEDHDALLLN